MTSLALLSTCVKACLLFRGCPGSAVVHTSIYKKYDSVQALSGVGDMQGAISPAF